MDDEPPDKHIDDPESISQNQRIQEILDRRADVLQTRDEAKQRALFGDVGERNALLFYRSELESLIHELWNVFRNLDVEEMDEQTGKAYLQTREIATFRIEPPPELEETVEQLSASASWPEAKEYTIKGLEWIIEAPETLTATFSVESLSPPKTVTDTREYVLQWAELDAVLRTTLEFIDVAGIDADLAEQEQRTKIDRELLEEVDEWRAENIES